LIISHASAELGEQNRQYLTFDDPGILAAAMLQRDIRDLANIPDLTAIPRLLSVMAARAGGLLNFADLSRTVGLPRPS